MYFTTSCVQLNTFSFEFATTTTLAGLVLLRLSPVVYAYRIVPFCDSVIFLDSSSVIVLRLKLDKGTVLTASSVLVVEDILSFVIPAFKPSRWTQRFWSSFRKIAFTSFTFTSFAVKNKTKNCQNNSTEHCNHNIVAQPDSENKNT